MKYDQLDRTALLWQLLAILVPIAPHFSHLPLWVPFLLMFCVGWRVMVFLGRWSFPKWYVRSAIVILAALGVIVSYKTGSGISSTVALLVTAFVLKSLEMYKQRDALVVVYVAYLVSATAFLFNQSILMALYVFFALLVCTTSLLAINLKKPVSFSAPFKRTTVLVLPVLPLMIVLFLFVPRISPLWQMGLDVSAAKTGLSERMSPGDITKLTRSAEIAFRVSFVAAVPQQQELYWRAIVLNDFDGRTWYNETESSSLNTLPYSENPNLEIVEYEVTLEANDRTYIPVLEQLQDVPAGLYLQQDLTLVAPDQQRQRSQYKLSSRLTNQVKIERDLFLQQRHLSLPEGNEESKQLANRWWQQTQNPQAYLNKILQNFNRTFVYTLQPSALGVNAIDEFMFKTQQGFCGHFSSATAFMLRAVGIPARIVTGYQGGEWNPFEDYLLVRQYDAHAWVEYWTEEKGWNRIDPTAFVAPERIEQPSDDLLSQEEQFLADNPLLSAAILNQGWLATLRLRMEALNYGWHRWVLGYHNQQQSFLSDLLGTITPLKLALLLIIPFGVVITATILMILKASKPVRLHPSDRLIVMLSDHLLQEGLHRKPGETVQHYCQRIGAIRTELAEPLSEVALLYEQIRYAGNDAVDKQKSLAVLVKNCCR